jgi:hypothetical protein
MRQSEVGTCTAGHIRPTHWNSLGHSEKQSRVHNRPQFCIGNRAIRRITGLPIRFCQRITTKVSEFLSTFEFRAKEPDELVKMLLSCVVRLTGNLQVAFYAEDAGNAIRSHEGHVFIGSRVDNAVKFHMAILN